MVDLALLDLVLTWIVQLENTDKSQVQERKIRVNWLAAAGDDDKAAASRNVIATPNKRSLVNGVRSCC